ncbi:helix-turn-helix domain-containing protein, partial [bacterium]|nr:helix-turn-helix domain-containing protein [bacterium]
MDKKLTIDNKKYLSSTHAGKISGYTNDYVARLARQKKVAGKKVGRTWYVEESSLKSFIQNNKIQKTNLHKKLSDKRTNDLKFFERDRKLSEEFQAFKSNVSLASKTELFKKSTAFALAIIFVFGGYFVSNTDIAQAGFRKVSQAVVGALDAVSKFNPAEFGISSVLTFKDAGKDAALNVHRGMEKSKLLSAEASKKTYLIAKGDSATWQDLKDGAIYKVNSSITSAIFNIKNNATKSVAGVSNIISPYSNFQNTRANVFASIAGSINSIIKDEALYVNKTVNSVICKFSTCGGEVEETVLVQVQKEIPKESIVKENIPEKVVVIDPSPKVVTNQPVIERVIETREIIVSGGITREDLELAIQQFSNKVYSDMSSLTSANETRIINNYSVIAQTNKIDKLGSVTISNSTISGTLSGLTDAHIPDSITASNYLPLTGGTLTGGLTAEYFTATSSTATSTFRGQISSTFVPTVAHSFGAWAVDVAGAEATNASFYINPASAAADTNLFSISVNDGAKFIIDAEGDLFANSITAVGGVTLSTTTASTFTVENDLTIGDATTTDSIYLNAMLASSLIPKYDNAFDIGSSSPQRMWRTGYFGTSIGIGTSSPYATLSIEGSSALGNSALAGYFTATSTTATSTIAGGLDIDNGGFVYDFTTNNVGIGTASPTQALDVVGTGTFSTSIIASTATLTGGSLTDSSGAISFGDENLTTTGTLSISGLTSLIQASTTRLSVFDTAYFGGTATSTFNSAGVLTMAGNIIMSDNSITGIDTLTFTDTSGTIAGIQNQNLVDKTATETILGLWNFTNTGTTTIANLWTENLQVGTVLEAPYFTATSTSQASTFPYASSTALTVSGSTYLGSLTGSLQAVNGLVSATSSLSSSFIEDVYLRNDANDTTTGTLTASSYLSSGSGTSTLANLWANIFQVGSLIETPYFNATSTTATSTIAWGLSANALNITSTTATSTFANGIDLANGCFSVNGSCVGSASAWASAGGFTTLSTATDFVGIGTTSPWGKFAIEQGTETNSFVVSNSGSSTPSFVVAGINGDGMVGIGRAVPQ